MSEVLHTWACRLMIMKRINLILNSLNYDEVNLEGARFDEQPTMFDPIILDIGAAHMLQRQ